MAEEVIRFTIEVRMDTSQGDDTWLGGEIARLCSRVGEVSPVSTIVETLTPEQVGTYWREARQRIYKNDAEYWAKDDAKPREWYKKGVL